MHETPVLVSSGGEKVLFYAKLILLVFGKQKQKNKLLLVGSQ